MLAEIECKRIAESNGTQRAYGLERCIHDLVRARATETPDAPAVVAGGRTLTYGELEARANSLAGELRSRGAGPNTVVGLCTARSPEMILGALSILKAGAAYLPLDPSNPPHRLDSVLKDAGCRLVAVGPGVAYEMDGTSAGGGVVNLNATTADSIRVTLQGPRSSAPPEVGTDADCLAYVIYTSGSTGRPKGVEITHASLLNLVFWHLRTFEVRRDDRASQVAAVGFDATVWEVWPYLAAGASVHVADEAVRNDPEAFRDWLLSQGITIGFAPTPLAERLFALKWPNKTHLRAILTGGDTLHRHPPADLPFAVVNNYGPTECTVVATSGLLHPHDRSDRRPTIGRPIDNTQIHILDDELREVPIGTCGEMYIGGAGVARGYRNQPELTGARFVPSPFEPGVRLYRSGDLARRLPDGQIAFLGRTDDQIKIRGFRIEPNEIVAALNEQPLVAASAVIASDMGGGDKRLVAYVVLAAGSRATKSGLQEVLRGRLPEYMVPTVFVRLDGLPLGPHGKVDRKALPEPNPGNTLRDTEFQEARTQVEERVAELVSTLLHLDQVSVDDNFFLLGGHSLMGTQLVARVGSVFGVDLPLRSVFDSPTIAQLSAKIEELLVAKVETMSEDEARRLLAQQQPTASP